MNAQVKEPGTQLTVIERASVALGASEREKELHALVVKSHAITTITNPDGYQECHAARMVLKRERLEIEKLGKTARDDANAFAKAVIAEERRLIGVIEGEEKRLQGLQEKWDADREAERQAAIKAEEERKARLQAMVEEIKQAAVDAAGLGSGAISLALADVRNLAIDESYQEAAPMAEIAKVQTVARLEQLHAAALAREQEAERLKKEREDLERRQAEQAERERIEALRIAAEDKRRQDEERERRDAIEAEERAARARIEQAEREAREKREAEEKAAREKREQEEAALKAERDRLEAMHREHVQALAMIEERERQERLAKEEAERKERQRIEEEQREAEYQERLKREAEEAEARAALETHELVIALRKKIAGKKKFVGVARAIDRYLAKYANSCADAFGVEETSEAA